MRVRKAFLPCLIGIWTCCIRICSVGDSWFNYTSKMLTQSRFPFILNSLSVCCFFPRFWKCCYCQTLSSKGSIQRRGGGLEQSVLHVSRDTGRADSLRIINRTSITGSRYRAGQPGQHVLNTQYINLE